MEISRTRPQILFLGMLLCGIISVFFGKELCWDLANYHFYNPYALLYGRHTIDYWPESYIHQYINPAIDLLTFFLIQSFTPWLSEFILGTISGLNFWLLFLIARFFLEKEEDISACSPDECFSHPGLFWKNLTPDEKSTHPGYKCSGLALIFALMGLCGPTSLPGIGSFQNDNLISIFVLGFVLLQLQGRLFFASLLLGLGFGLKLTAGIYIAGAVLACLLMPLPFKVKCKSIFIMGLGIFIGMMMTGGYWMLMMWQEHHNPFFPFFNFSSGGFRDIRFLPKDLLQTIFYPFYFSFDGRTADAPFRDFRFAVVYVLLVVAAVCHAHLSSRRRFLPRDPLLKNTDTKQEIPRCEALGMTGPRWLSLFFIFSYLIWQHYFSIARYLAPLEMLAPLIIYLLLGQLIHNMTTRLTLLFSLFAGILLSLSPIPMIRAPWYDNTFFNVNMPDRVSRIPDATVFMAYSAYVLNVNPRPQSYLIPFFPSAWHFIGIPFLNEKIMLDTAAQKTIASRLPQNAKSLFLLAPERNMPELFKAAHLFGFSKYGQCEKITSDRQAMTHQHVLLCQMYS